MTDHEGHLFGGGIFGCEDEIAFVLAGDRVEDNDKFAVRCVARLVNHTFPLMMSSMAGAEDKGSRDTWTRLCNGDHTESSDTILNAVELQFGYAIPTANMTVVHR